MRRALAPAFVLGMLFTTTVVAAVIEGVRVGATAAATRLVLDLSDSVQYTAVARENPAVLVLEITDAQVRADLAKLPLQGTPVRRVRSEVQSDGALRIVFDLRAQVQFDSFTLKPYLQRGHRLVLDMQQVGSRQMDVVSDLASVREKTTPPPASSSSRHSGKATGRTVDEGSSAQDLPAVRADEPRSMGRAASPPLERQQQSSWQVEFSGTWEQEWAYSTEQEESQKFEAIVEPRWDVHLPGDLSLTIIGRIRLDGVGDLGPDQDRPRSYSAVNGPAWNNAHVELSLPEFYLDAEWGGGFWRVGKQQVVWGQADGIKVLDVVNPQSFREFILDDFDSSRIPLWMLNLEMPVGDESTLQLLWIPDTTYHELAERDNPYFFTSPRLVPLAPPGVTGTLLKANTPDHPLQDGDAGLRYSSFVGGWDVTLNYLYHYQDFPVLYQFVAFADGQLQGLVTPEYERNHMLGGTLSNVLGDVTLRAELAHNTDTFHIAGDLSQNGIAGTAELASVIGLDWQISSETLLSAQWFQSHLLDYESSIKREETEQTVSLLLQQYYDNETWQFNALGLYSVDHEDAWLQLKLKYLLQGNLELWLSADVFDGDRDGLFGQFSRQDRVLIGINYGF